MINTQGWVLAASLLQVNFSTLKFQPEFIEAI